MSRLPAFTPRQALLLSVAAALLTIGMKSGAWWLTGSVGYLSDALESLVNLAGASFALWMVSGAQSPADERHPFGHGKAEYFSVAFEGGLIFLASLAILLAAGERLLNPQPLGALGVGTGLSVAASLINLLVAQVLFVVARRHTSMALEADARHLMTDVWTTAGVILGVAAASLTGWLWLDPLIACLVAFNILREGGSLVQRAIHGLLDQALSPDKLAQLQHALQTTTAAAGCQCTGLKTRASGSQAFATVKLRVPGQWTVLQAHTLADQLEQAVMTATGVDLTTHIEPMEPDSAPSPTLAAQ